MSDDDDTTIGTGGWVLTALSGLVSFAGLFGFLHYQMFPSIVFALAISLIVLLLLHRLATAVNRYDDAEEANRVRKIVPGNGSGGQREGAAAMAVPMRPEPSTPVPVRPSSVVRPLAEVASAPIIAPPPVPAAAVLSEPAPAEAVAALAAPKPKAKPAPKPKAAAGAKVGDAAKPKAKVAAKPAEKAAPAAKTEKAPKPKAAKPEGLVRLKAPRKGRADDLKEIEGIGPALEKMVNGLGFYHFDQIAAWTAADVALVDAEMKTFKGRITRDKWVEQAKIIVLEGLDAFRERARTNDY
jgi:predicted flap endonuclease-1-like 5' DNA nuclease